MVSRHYLLHLAAGSAVAASPCAAIAKRLAAGAGDPALHSAIAATFRPAEDRVRDTYRHPYETLTF